MTISLHLTARITLSICALVAGASSLSAATVDLTSQLEDLGSSELLMPGKLPSNAVFWRGKLWVFGASEGRDTPPVTYDPATGVWARDNDTYLDTEKVWRCWVQDGDLMTSAEDEQGDDNGTSGYLRTDRGWHRFNVPGANAHQQGQGRLGKRWFSGSYANDNVNARPWIAWSDDLGVTATTAPAGSFPTDIAPQSGAGGLVACFLNFRHGIFASGANFNNFSLLHYTGVDANPFELTYRVSGEWCAAPEYSELASSVEFNGYVFATMGSQAGGWAAQRWSAVAKPGVNGRYLAPGEAQFLAGPYWGYAGSQHPNPRHYVCGNFVAKHGYLWAIYADMGWMNRVGGPDFRYFRIGDDPTTMTIERTSDGDTWETVAQVVPGPGVFHNLAKAYPSPRLLIADNGDLWLKGQVNFYRLSAALLGGYNPPNHAPVAVDDAFRTGVGATLDAISGADGVLSNDRDVDHDDLVAELMTNPVHGALTFYPNGGFTYVPTAGYQGLDAFTYRISDGRAPSAVATARLVIGTPANANSAPIIAVTGSPAPAGVWFDLVADISDDGLPVSGALTYQWSFVSGPATPELANLFATVPSAKMSADGTYVFRVISNDGARSTAADLVLTVGGEVPPVLPTPTLLAGDLNRDGVVDAADVTLVTNQFGRSGAEITDSRADVDGNGSVNAGDVSAVTGGETN